MSEWVRLRLFDGASQYHARRLRTEAGRVMPMMLNGIKDAGRHECRTVCRDQRPAIESEVVT